MSSNEIGFVGLGHMGRPMAENLMKAGWAVVVHDAVGSQARAPRGVKLKASNAALAGRVETIHLCVPDGRASESIVREIAGAPDRRTRLVVDHSTIGTAAARRVHELLAGHGIEYVDAPVPGGVSGAVNATLSIVPLPEQDMTRNGKGGLERSRASDVCETAMHHGRRPGRAREPQSASQLPAAWMGNGSSGTLTHTATASRGAGFEAAGSLPDTW